MVEAVKPGRNESVPLRQRQEIENCCLDVFGGGRPIDVMQRTNGPEKVEAVIEETERHARASGPEGSVEALARLRERLGLVCR